MAKPRKQKGFTLMEMMIVVAIVGILASIVTPFYRDYVIQARMTSALDYASQLKTDATAYYQFHREFPHGGGNALKKVVDAEVVYALEHWAPNPTAETFLHIYLQPDAFPGATTAHALILKGTAANGKVTWNCVPHTGFRKIPDQYVPTDCLS